VLVAHEGETAMHAIRRELPDLVVLDLMLPGRDGWQIARWMREDKRLASIRTGMLPKSMGNDTLQPICSELYRFRVDV
jgi:DNA-binding response OmpR family regulator